MAPENEPAFPPLYVGADSAAVGEQRAYYRQVAVELVLLVFAALVSAFPLPQGKLSVTGQEVSTGQAHAAAVGLTLVALLFVRLLRKYRGNESRWFATRAMAESVKVETWHYMMRAKPYHDETTADRRFRKNLNNLLQSNREVFGALAEQPVEAGSQITPGMRTVRALSLNDRLSYYAQHRLGDQRGWYSRRSRDHSGQQRRWSGIGVALEGLAILVAFWAMVTGSGVGVVGVLTTASAGAVAWLQAKDFQRLATSYNLIAHELSNLESLVEEVATEDDLSGLVIDVERTISREHTYWLSRRAPA